MGLYSKDPFEELEAKLQVVEGKIDYIVRLLKQNGFKDYEMEAAYKANLAMAKEINAKWAKEMAEAMNAKPEDDIRKSQDNSQSE